MLTLRKVAITGGLSSGKSTVCEIFKDLGAYTVSSDQIVHQLLLHDRLLQKKIIRLLGPEILTNHHIDREKVAKLVFANQEKLQALEKLIHPAVFHEIQSLYNRVKKGSSHRLFIAEVPLLFETEQENLFDTVVTVLSNHETCKNRFNNMNNRSEADFNDRMMRQMSPEEKAARSDFILINNGTLEDLRAQVTELTSKLCST